jgi:VWFA-related protein
MRRRLPLLALFAAVFALAAPAAVRAEDKRSAREVEKEQQEAVARLPESYRVWIESVDLLLSREEKAAFLALTQDYQRDAFIKRFWEQRDTLRRTARNEFREQWEARVEEARRRFGDITEARSRVLLLNGPPADVLTSYDCPLLLVPLEIWFYPSSDRVPEPFIVVLYRKWGSGPFRIWNPKADGYEAFIPSGVEETRPNVGDGNSGVVKQEGRGRMETGKGGNLGAAPPLAQTEGPFQRCGPGDKGRRMAGAVAWVAGQGLRWEFLEAKLDSKPEPVGDEWVSTFRSYSTDLPEGAALLAASLELAFPGRYQGRTMLQGTASVPAGEAGQAKLGEHASYNLLLTGEVLRDGELFESFRYKFDLPVHEAPDPLPLVFQRPLRPGEYTLVVRIDDVNSGRVFREERKLSVPAVERVLPVAAAAPEDAESARLLAEANAALTPGETTIRIISPLTKLQTGMVRFDTLATGAIERVEFTLDGRSVLTKRAPPYSVELDLGKVPRTRTLAVTAFDAAGQPQARDELVLNSAGHRFQVRLVEPVKGKRYSGSLLARAEATAPEGETIERVEIYLNETRVATLYQPPYVHPVFLPRDGEIAYVRAVAFLLDGNSTEHLTFVNAPENLEEIDVDFVELYATALDRKGRPVPDLERKDFAVREDGARQEIARFERVTDLPVHVAVALDVSASMEPALEKAQDAALRFFEGTIRPKDRAAVITFNDHPNLAVKFTNEVKTLAGGLAGLRAERGTALYDALVFSLYYFNGIRGQRAILLLSDGKDEGSRFTYEEALEYVHRAGVTIYTIGLGEKLDRKKLEKIAEETGGRSFFLRSADELAGIYAAVEEELRSKYLIAYQSGNTTGSTAFRSVELEVARPGVEVKTMRGYYP